MQVEKSRYELKQSPRQWYKRFDSFIRGKRYKRSHYDPYLYYNKLLAGEYIYLLLHVIAILVTSKNRSIIDKLKKDLSFEFDMKELGEAK